ncbi:MAG: hypothetical protein ACREI7_08505 [Myxococcota bacterium]
MLGICSPAFGQPHEPTPGVRFAALDVFLDSDTPLAAWQFELGERNGLMTVVGVENGESAAFGRAPYYDLEAVQQDRVDRVIVADFSLQPAASLPVGRTRIATIHVRLAGEDEPDYQLRLLAAGDAAGRPIDAAISFSAQTGRRE